MDGNQLPQNQDDGSQPFQPGMTISPGAIANDAAPVAPTNPAPQQQQVVQPVVPVEAANPAPIAPIAATFPQPSPNVPSETPYSMNTAAMTPDDPPYQVNPEGAQISWTASEFVAHQKSSSWYLALLGAALVIMGLVWILTKDIFPTVVVALAVAVLAIYGSRKPRELQYAIDDRGIMVGERTYDYSMFRSFSVVDDGAFSSIELMPLKRLSPPITIYFAPNDENAIADAVAAHLPFEHRDRDVIEQLMRRIRF